MIQFHTTCSHLKPFLCRFSHHFVIPLVLRTKASSPAANVLKSGCGCITRSTVSFLLHSDTWQRHENCILLRNFFVCVFSSTKYRFAKSGTSIIELNCVWEALANLALIFNSFLQFFQTNIRKECYILRGQQPKLTTKISILFFLDPICPADWYKTCATVVGRRGA